MRSKTKKSVQDKQDNIFRKMSADKKLEVAAGLWLLAKELNPNNVKNGRNNRPATASYKRR